ncbi:hypothetical protein [Streptomyces sp. NPDC012888]|uniref:hypothetical protein n=1 Tax=Streptomyces sp. NPDC012888 TaxID=3364855 RepID=UPI0036B4064D
MNEGTFGIFDAGDVPVETADWSGDLVAPMARGAMVLTGVNTGNAGPSAGRSAPAPRNPDEVLAAAWDICRLWMVPVALDN